ncbi:MAG: glycosyltransferase family 2 protein [Mameliella sp.]|nr:glycosyltransferase family 2 protein [Mameliella sp.]
MTQPTVTVVILTKNEERHIARCLDSVAPFATQCLVVDSGSTDRTMEIAREKGASVLENPWINYATQMNWGIDRVPAEADWVMRLDADEYITEPLAQEIVQKLGGLGDGIDGVYVSRRMTFLRKRIRFGGIFPVRVLRLFRNGRGRCENRWMDEHILVPGQTADFDGELIDDNHNSLAWWTEKHNGYSNREVVDLLNLEYGFMPHETVADLKGGQQAGVKRWLKEKVYANMPTGSRALAYFLYRYVLRLGFLDGREGAAFHFLQGFWYRYLVDMKLFEVKRHMERTGADVETAIRDVLGIQLQPQPPASPAKPAKLG